MKSKHSLIHQFLEQSAGIYPDKVALVHEGIRATYSDINNKANQLAYWLMDQGVQRGDRVVVLLENSLEYVVGYYGILKAGAVAVPLSTDTKPDNLRYCLSELEPKALISSSKFERLLKATDLSPFKIDALVLKTPKMNWSSRPFPVFTWEDITKGDLAASPQITINDSQLTTIIYTSGSTGKPKGVMLSHRNIVSNTHAICHYLHLTEKDIQMVVLPFFYVMGKSLLNTHFAVGGRVVLNNKFAYTASVVRQMCDEKVTGFSGVPSTYAYLLEKSPLARYRESMHSLRYCSQAGGHMARHLKEKLKEALPAHTDIYIMYGATEASARLTYLPPGQYETKMDSIGKPIPGVSIKVLDKRGKEVPTGREGELVAGGSNIMLGYWNNVKETKRAIGPNGYHTGDFGYRDAEGYLYVVGRKDNIVKIGGNKVSTQEIEDTLMETDLVIEALVLGLPDALLEYRLVALACPKNGECSEALLLSRCAERLPKYKVPSEVRLLRSLPKGSSGKIDRNKCLDLLNQRPA